MTERRHLHTGQIRDILERAIKKVHGLSSGLTRDLEDVLAEVAPDCPGCREIHESYPIIRHEHSPCCRLRGKCATCETGEVPKLSPVGTICATCYGDDPWGDWPEAVKKSDTP